jgi:predicted nucleic acid-binding protein
MIHLDTCFLIRALVPGTDADRRLREWLSEGRQICMDSIAWTEFLCGPLESGQRALAERIVNERVDYSEQDAQKAAEIFDVSGRRRGTLADCMIAAVASRRGAALATLNSQDFQRFEALGLRLA